MTCEVQKEAFGEVLKLASGVTKKKKKGKKKKKVMRFGKVLRQDSQTLSRKIVFLIEFSSCLVLGGKLLVIIKSNLHYTRGITPKRLTSGGIHLRYSRYYTEAFNKWWDPSPRLRAWATQLRRSVAEVASR